MTHPSGLQYSYDDLDLVCCHGVDSEGPWMETGASKQGRRTRCASMPEGCHQLPTEGLPQTLEMTASVGNGDTESKQLKLMKNNEKVPLELIHGLHTLVDVDICQGASESEQLQTTNIVNFQEFPCNLNSTVSSTNISGANDSSTQSEKTCDCEGEVGTEGRQSHDICNDSNGFKSPQVQQCISISLNNGLPLSESAGEHPGKLPDHQETKESHTEGYSRPPEISEATQNSPSAVELEPQTDLPDNKETFLTSYHAGESVTVLVSALQSSVMEGVDMMSPASKSVKPDVIVVVEEGHGEGVTESGSADSSYKLDGLTTTVGCKRHSRHTEEGMQDDHDCTWVLDQAHGCEIQDQTLLEQHNLEMRAMIKPQGEESPHAERSKKTADVRCGAVPSSDICLKGQCCSMSVKNNGLSVQEDTGYSEKDPIQTNVECLGEVISLGQPMEETNESSQVKKLVCCEDQNLAQQMENRCLKLDTILEDNVKPSGAPVHDPKKFTASDLTKTLQCCMHDKHASSEKHAKDLPSCSAEVSDELSSEELHGNQPSGNHFYESPVSDMADGQSEHHRPRAAVSRMEDADEAILDGSNAPASLKEDNLVKLRMRKVRLYDFKGFSLTINLRLALFLFLCSSCASGVSALEMIVF